MKKIILTVFAATSLLLYSTPSFAFSISVGVPVGSTITGEKPSSWAKQFESEGVSGYFLGVQLPFALGLGMDSHKVKGDKPQELVVDTNMYNLFYQLPIPVINLILGVGTGNQEFKCDDYVNGTSCSDAFDKGSATQFYTSLGFPIMPLFDLHISYRMITSKNIKVKGSEATSDMSGSVAGVGFAFNF